MVERVSYPTALKKFRERYVNKEVLFEAMGQLPNYGPHLRTASTCLSIGTGYEEFDIEFIRRCLPNLKKIIAIEKDCDCVEQLKVNLKNHFGKKLDIEIYEMPVENFIDIHEKKNGNTLKSKIDIKKLHNGNIDVVLALHVIYFLNKRDRKRLYKMCFDRWLRKDSGLFVFANANINNDIVRMVNQLDGAHPILRSEIIKDELYKTTASELKLLKESNYKCSMDMSYYDVDLHRMFEFTFKRSNVKKECVMKALEVIADDDGIIIDDCDLCIYGRTFYL